MSMLYLSAADREAVEALRMLLRGDHALSPTDEERLIAAYLAARTNAVQGAPAGYSSPQLIQPPLSIAQILPGAMPALIVCLNFLMVFLYVANAGTLDSGAFIVLGLFNIALFLALFAGLLAAYATSLKRLVPSVLSGLISVAIAGTVFCIAIPTGPAGPLLLLALSVLILVRTALRVARRQGLIAAPLPSDSSSYLLHSDV